MVFNGAVKGV